MCADSVKCFPPRPTSITDDAPRISLFAEHEREARRVTIGDPLVVLAKYVDFETLAASIDNAAPRPARTKGGRPPYPTVLMVKILVLKQLYNLADDALEYQLLTGAASYCFSA
jgi:IS5 family transposase